MGPALEIEYAALLALFVGRQGHTDLFQQGQEHLHGHARTLRHHGRLLEAIIPRTKLFATDGIGIVSDVHAEHERMPPGVLEHTVRLSLFKCRQMALQFRSVMKLLYHGS